MVIINFWGSLIFGVLLLWVISFLESKFYVIQQKLGDQNFLAVIDFLGVEQMLGVPKYCLAKQFGKTFFEHANLFGSHLLYRI